MNDYYDRQGNPISVGDWTLKDNCVAHTKLDGAEVSTVYLGLDHRYGDGPPLIFETMIFGGSRNEDQWRYSTEAEALAGHERAVQLATADAYGRGIDAGIAAYERQ